MLQVRSSVFSACGVYVSAPHIYVLGLVIHILNDCSIIRVQK